MADLKRLAIVGSTGSIGRQTLDIVRSFPDRLSVVGLAGGRKVDLLAEQMAEFLPDYVSSQEPLDAELLRLIGCSFCTLEELAALPEADIVVMATTGRVGLLPTLAAIRAGKRIVLANKEVLVMAGELVTRLAREHAACLIPVDSEHSAVWQCLQGETAEAHQANEIEKVILTASGGAFRDYPREQLAGVTVEQALTHPNWVMGPKVTIDSATLLNKGFEVIETRWLFGVPYEKIEIVLHRESIIHSMVQFSDGAVKAQLSPPDMRLSIQYALSHPQRWSNSALPRLDFSRALTLSFGVPDLSRYPCLELALDAARRGGTYPAVLSAADEVAVERFVVGSIGFLDIPKLIERALNGHHSVAQPTLDDILAAETWVHREALAEVTR